MDVLTNLEYFFYGSSIQNADGNHVQYGLFNAVDDRFILTSTDVEVLHWISFLFSSRYNLSVYRLDTAENFQPNLIDNTVCTKWTISNDQLLKFTKFNEWRDVVDVKKLHECPEFITDGLLKNDIPYIMASHYWISKYLAMYKQIKIGHIITNRLIDLPLSDPVVDVCRHIFMTIYQEPDFQKAQAIIGMHEKS